MLYISTHAISHALLINYQPIDDEFSYRNIKLLTVGNQITKLLAFNLVFGLFGPECTQRAVSGLVIAKRHLYGD
jgi:hypothetical protein